MEQEQGIKSKVATAMGQEKGSKSKKVCDDKKIK